MDLPMMVHECNEGRIGREVTMSLHRLMVGIKFEYSWPY